MRGWRKKMLVVLVVYFAGFASAIYTLAPAGAQTISSGHSGSGRSEYAQSSVDTDAIAEQFKTNMQKVISFAEEKASKVGSIIRTKLDE